jgi:hypothetical protein
MVLLIDSLDVEGKKTLVIVLPIIGLVLSHVTFGLRVWVKKTTLGHLQKEDWFMFAALMMSYSFVACEFYGKSFYVTYGCMIAC